MGRVPSLSLHQSQSQKRVSTRRPSSYFHAHVAPAPRVMSYRPCERNQTLITMTRAIEQNDRLWMPPTSPAFVIHSVPNGGSGRGSHHRLLPRSVALRASRWFSHAPSGEMYVRRSRQACVLMAMVGLGARPVRGYRGLIDGVGLRYRLVIVSVGGMADDPAT